VFAAEVEAPRHEQWRDHQEQRADDHGAGTTPCSAQAPRPSRACGITSERMTASPWGASADAQVRLRARGVHRFGVSNSRVGRCPCECQWAG
jgi:hypothetical protein